MISLKDFQDLSRIDENVLVSIIKATVAELVSRDIDKHFLNDYIESGRELGQNIKTERAIRNNPRLSKVFADIKAIIPFAGSIRHSKAHKMIIVNDQTSPGYTILQYNYGLPNATTDALRISSGFRRKINSKNDAILANRMVDIADYDPTPKGISISL